MNKRSELGVPPLTEDEREELLDACNAVLTPKGLLLLRRLMYELDFLKLTRGL